MFVVDIVLKRQFEEFVNYFTLYLLKSFVINKVVLIQIIQSKCIWFFRISEKALQRVVFHVVFFIHQTSNHFLHFAIFFVLLSKHLFEERGRVFTINCVHQVVAKFILLHQKIFNM